VENAPYIDARVPNLSTPNPAEGISPQRQWFVTGKEVPALAGVDALFQAFMQANGVRAGELAILKNGRLKFARAYTWAEPGYRIVQPADPFRLASCSKMFLEEAVQSLYDAGKLTPDTKVYPLLGFSEPQDPLSDLITLQQLLDHMGGYDQAASGFDPVFNMRQIAKNLGMARAVTKQDIATYMYKNTRLDHPPGAQYAYSNYGYLLAGMAVEKASGLSFMDYVNQKVLQPAGLAPMHLSPTAQGSQALGEPPYEDTGSGVSALDPTSDLMVPAPYGGDQLLYEVADACSGIACTAVELAKFIHLYKVWGNGTRDQWKLAPRQYYDREGSMPGTFSWAESRGDGVDWVFVFNTRNFLDKSDPLYQMGNSVDDPDQGFQKQVDQLLNSLEL